VAAHRCEAPDTGGNDARKLGQAIFDIAVKRKEFVVLIAGEARIRSYDENVLALEADVLGLQGEEAMSE
jgi:hypothetical protein